MTNENWVPLLDYAVLTNTSISTLRRRIKANKIQHKIVKGRYLVQDENEKLGLTANTQGLSAGNQPLNWDNNSTVNGISVFQRVRELEEKLSKSQEQISELKMLVSIYEEKLGHKA